MASVAVTGETFDQVVADNDIVFVDFWASWCGPCRTFGPIYESVAEGHPDVLFAKVDTEAEQELAASFQIMSIPTLMVMRQGIVLFSQPGVIPETGLEELVTQAKALDMDEVRRSIAEHEHSA